MTKIQVTDPAGKTHTLAAPQGWRVMEVIKEAGLPMRADCGGCCACATCHVYVDEAWLDKLRALTDEETDLLAESFARRDNSRLACQIIVKPDLDGMSLTIAEDAV